MLKVPEDWSGEFKYPEIRNRVHPTLPAQQVLVQIITACHFSNDSAHCSDNKKLFQSFSQTRLLLAKTLFYEIRLSYYVGHVLKDTHRV